MCWVVISCLKIFFVNKNWVGLTLGGGLMTPLKIVGLKVCWLCIICPEIFFVQKQIGQGQSWGDGGQGLMTPYPFPLRKSMFKIVQGCCKLSKKKLSEKNGIVLAIGGGMTPPPQNIVGLKLCRVVLSCQKIFFVRKKWEMVNPRGGRGEGNCVWLLWVGGGVV